MTTDLQPINLSLDSPTGYELLRESLNDFRNSLASLPTTCENPDDQQRLVQIIAEGNKLIKTVEEERLKITREIDKQKQHWISEQRKLTDPIETALAPYKQSVHAYNVERVRQIREAEDLQRQAEQALIEQNGQADWLQAKTRPEHNPKGVQMRWTFEVESLTMVPNQFLQVNEKAVREAISRGMRNIDGLKIYQEPISTFRA
ncbi:hypothetical protein [Spirosoma sp. 48-14]|uniref:hypothetical protein n=1 Tax=Spirosoma sp. 48-14 TaxID=1895854 RepID=UPI000959B484|nr:hypothetical protein [Spirosoma sp. 48-14]OJW75687.1 MAG: hypothetical protein BGO59_08970 [Spirosoma sp. 48-14]